MSEDLFSGVGILVDIITPTNFNLIKETLTRIGIANEKEKKLYQSCHILHKKDDQNISRYAIVSFKEMFILDGKENNMTDSDNSRIYYVTEMLENWNLLKIIDDTERYIKIRPNIKVLSHKDKNEWELISKYTIGTKK